MAGYARVMMRARNHADFLTRFFYVSSTANLVSHWDVPVLYGYIDLVKLGHEEIVLSIPQNNIRNHFFNKLHISMSVQIAQFLEDMEALTCRVLSASLILKKHLNAISPLRKYS